MPPRLLLIEPSRDLRCRFTRALERRGLVVLAASTATEALPMSQTFSPDIVIADYDMGDGKAADLVRELRRRNPAIVVLLTSDAFPTEQKLGSIRLLPKPSEPVALLGLLRQAVIADSLWLVRHDAAPG
jgi:CheY-like chemotaxis protein